MDRQEAIKRLKENKEAFGLMDKELQELAKELYLEMELYKGGSQWMRGDSIDCRLSFWANNAFRLRPDYTEQPEEIVCEVKPFWDPVGQSVCLVVAYEDDRIPLTSAIGWIPAEGYRFARAEFKDGSVSYSNICKANYRATPKARCEHACKVIYTRAK